MASITALRRTADASCWAGATALACGDPAAPTLRLRNGLVELFPELENVRLSHSWFGNVAMHRDMLPRIFEKDGVVYATGFCGSGVVWAPWVGTRAAHKLMGHGEQARTAFDFRPPAAIPFYRGNPWFMPADHQGLCACRTVSPGGAPAADGQSWRPIDHAALRPLPERSRLQGRASHALHLHARPSRTQEVLRDPA